METLTLTRELRDKNRLLYEKTEELSKLGAIYGNAEKDYRVAMATKILELKAQDYPATLIIPMARGDNFVATKKMEQLIAKANYDSCQEMINTLKIQLKILQEEINKEFYREDDTL